MTLYIQIWIIKVKSYKIVYIINNYANFLYLKKINSANKMHIY